MGVLSCCVQAIECCRGSVSYLANHQYAQTEISQCTRWEDNIGMVFRSSLNDAQAGFGETCFRSGPGAGPRAMQQRCASRLSFGQLITTCTITFTLKAPFCVRACLRMIRL